MTELAIGHQTGYRPKGLLFVKVSRTVRIGAVKNCRRDKGAASKVLPRQPRRFAADDAACLAFEHLAFGKDVLLLAAACQRPHANLFQAWVADRHIIERSPKRLGHRLAQLLGNENSPYRRAFLSSLGRNLTSGFLDEEVEFRIANHNVGAENGGVQRVLLGREPDRSFEQVRRTTKHHPGYGRPGEADGVLRPEHIEKRSELSGD